MKIPSSGRFILSDPRRFTDLNLTPLPQDFPKLTVHGVKSSIWEPNSNERGLVISPRMKLSEQGVQFHGWDHQQLRNWLLFWDRLDWPKTGIIDFDSGAVPDYQFLVSQGVLRSSLVSLSGAGMLVGQTMLDAHLEAYRALDKSEPGIWSVATGEGSIGFPDAEVEEGRGLLVSLTDALPVPTGDTPLEAVFEFLERRRAERLALRAHLESLYQAIFNSGDQDLAKVSAFESLDRALADHIKVSSESGLPFKWSTLQANLKVDTALAAAAGWGAAQLAGMPMAASAAAAVGAGALRIAGSVGFSVGLKGRTQSASPFQYITSYSRELPTFQG